MPLYSDMDTYPPLGANRSRMMELENYGFLTMGGAGTFELLGLEVAKSYIIVSAILYITCFWLLMLAYLHSFNTGTKKG
jgi:hypothetical protein